MRISWLVDQEVNPVVALNSVLGIHKPFTIKAQGLRKDYDLLPLKK